MEAPHENLITPGDINAKFPVPGREEGSGYLTLNESKMGLVLIQEWWGVNKTMCNKADLIAKSGFRVLGKPSHFDSVYSIGEAFQ